MAREPLPDGARRLKLCFTLSPDAVAALDRVIELGFAATRSAAAEWAIREAEPAELGRVRAKRRASR